MLITTRGTRGGMIPYRSFWAMRFGVRIGGIFRRKVRVFGEHSGHELVVADTVAAK